MNSKERHAGGDLRDLFVGAARDILDRTEISLDLRKVAERAGKSRTAPYLAFGKSEEGGGLPALQMAVAADGFTSLVEGLRRAHAQTPNTEEALEAVAGAYLAFARAHPRLFRHMFDPELGRLLLVEAHCEPAVREQVGLGRARARLEDSFTRLARMQRSWYLKGAEELDPATVGTALWAMIHGVAVLTIDRQWELGALGRGSAQVQAERVLRFLTTASYRSIREVARELDLARQVRGAYSSEESLDEELLDREALTEDRRAKSQPPGSNRRAKSRRLEGSHQAKSGPLETSRREAPGSRKPPSAPYGRDAEGEVIFTLREGDDALEYRAQEVVEDIPSPRRREAETRPAEASKAAPRGGASASSSSSRVAASGPPPPAAQPPATPAGPATPKRASEGDLPSPALRRAVTLGSRLRGRRVLWIEDRPHRVRHERLVLEKLGMDIRMVATSQAAFEALDRGQPDLIVSNVRREGTDDEGIRVLPALLALTAPAPVIYYEPPSRLGPAAGAPPSPHSPAPEPRTSSPHASPPEPPFPAPTPARAPAPTPAGAFGLTGDPDELLHLVVDAVERV